jgi:hypothetical protein
MSATYTAVLPFQDHTVEFVTGLPEAERVRRGTRKGARKLTSRDQAVLVLRWFTDATRVTQLIVDHGVTRSTGYDYLHEVRGRTHQVDHHGHLAPSAAGPQSHPHRRAAAGGEM